MIKFFVDAENITGGKIYLDSQDEIRHLVKVLRSKPGDRVMISDKEEWEYTAEILEIGDSEVVFTILDRQKFAQEPETRVTLYQGVPKAAKLETIVQKTVELGVKRIVPVFMSRTVVTDKGNFSKKIARLQKIADEAVKQCKRGIIPDVGPAMNFREMISDIEKKEYDAVIIPYENEDGFTLKDALRYDSDLLGLRKGSSIALIIGPEGGFEEDEVELVRDTFDRKAQVVSLGKTILRTETAGMAALAMIMYELEL